MRTQRTSSALLVGVLSGVMLYGGVVSAASSANISHAYKSTAKIPEGSLVSLDSSKSDYIVPANTDNGTKLVGVSVPSDDSLLAVDPDNGTVQVATSGTATALVSTVGGDIKVGDQIGVSPFNGVGMKAVSGSRVVGVAQTAFTASTNGATKQQVTDKSGKTQTVSVGYIRINIGVGTSTSSDGSENLNALQRFVRSLTGKTIPTARIIIALVVAIIALAALVALIYAAIFGSIISVGRNPLAKHAIFRTLSGVIAMACVMAAVAAATVFFLLG